MADLLNTPSAMQQVGQLPLMFTNRGLDYLNQAQGADQATLAELMKQRERTQQTHDLNMQQGQATLAGTLLGNQSKEMDNSVRKATMPQEIQDKLNKFAQSADDFQWSQFESKIRNGLQSQDPTVRAQAQAMYEQLPKQLEARQKHKFDMEKEKEQTRRATSVATIGADSRREVQDMRNRQAKDLADIKAAASGGKQNLNQLATSYISQAQAATDPQQRAYFMQLANTVAQVAAQMNPAGQAPQVNPDALPPGTPLQAPPQPQMPPAPTQQQAAPQFSPQQSDWIQRAMKANPGMTQEQIIQEGKKLGKL